MWRAWDKEKNLLHKKDIARSMTLGIMFRCCIPVVTMFELCSVYFVENFVVTYKLRRVSDNEI